ALASASGARCISVYSAHGARRCPDDLSPRSGCLVPRRRQVPQLVRIAHHVQRPNDVAFNLECRCLHRSLWSVHNDAGQAINGRKAQREVLAAVLAPRFTRDANQEPRRGLINKLLSSVGLPFCYSHGSGTKLQLLSTRLGARLPLAATFKLRLLSSVPA